MHARIKNIYCHNYWSYTTHYILIFIIFKVYESSVMWLKHDINERGKYLEELMQFVRLNLLPIEYLDHYVQEENLIKSNLKCKFIFVLLKILLLGFSEIFPQVIKTH